MDISWLTLRDLEYLVAVADHRHFGHAAEACHVSQPALSGQIKKLEEHLGASLFERSNRRVALTETGEAVVAQARVVMDEARKLTGLASREHQPLTSTFRLGAIATLGPYFIPHLLAPLKKRYPKLDLILREGLTDGLLHDLRTGTLDAVLAARTFDEQGLRVLPLFFEPFWLAAPREHPLAAQKTVRTADLKASEMVLLEDGHCLRDQALAFCSRKKDRTRNLHATGLETLRHLVASGQGYTLIPQLALRDDDPLRKLLVYRELDRRDVGRTIVLVTRERHARMPDIEALAAFVRADKLARAGLPLAPTKP